MSFDSETLYNLLPAVYRVRDAALAEDMQELLTPAETAEREALILKQRLAASGGPPFDERDQARLAVLDDKRLRGPLKALITVVAEQISGIEENLDQLYDDQFIETCGDWVVPYIADLIGYRPLDPRLQRRLRSTRAEVANTIRNRRRKGTASILEEIALDITSWDAAVAEFFLRLSTTQYLNHVRPDHVAAPDLRRTGALETVGGPFDQVSRSVDVRHVDSGRGRYNIPNVGIFLWRVDSQQVTEARAFGLDNRRFLFSPLGNDTPLYAKAVKQRDPSEPVRPSNVPMPITRRALREGLLDSEAQQLAHLYGPVGSFRIRVNGAPVPASAIEACDLSNDAAVPGSWTHMSQARIAVDPVLGRIAFPDATPKVVDVTYHYGQIGRLGAGEFDRSEGLDAVEDAVSVPSMQPTIQDALNALAGEGVIDLEASNRFDEAFSLQVNAQTLLQLRAANERRPHLQLPNPLVISGGPGGEVVLNGLMIAGNPIVVPATMGGATNRLQRLRLVHCTLVPGLTLTGDGQPGSNSPSLIIEAPSVSVELDHCIVGPIRAVDGASVSVADGAVDGLSQAGVAFAAPEVAPNDFLAGAPLNLTATTVIGRVHTRALVASNSILDAAVPAGDTRPPVVVERRQEGYLRYCYVPFASRVPRRYACHPATSLDEVRPQFVARRYGVAGYLQLHSACPALIGRGADDESEMGVYHELLQPLLEAGLRERLDEYLRFGLEAGLLYAS